MAQQERVVALSAGVFAVVSSRTHTFVPHLRAFRPELLQAIRVMQTQNHGPDAIPGRQRGSEKSLLTRIEALTLTNKKLREDNCTLRQRLELGSKWACRWPAV